jgi:lycopene cyclase domain-containing protein
MTYFGFLAIFLGIPLLIVGLLSLIDRQRKRALPAGLSSTHPAAVLLLHVFLAVAYTTPWDNYLVATGVWYYDPSLVTGIRIGWVPIEEYIFFVVQTLLSGSWLLFLARRLSAETSQSSGKDWPAQTPRGPIGFMALLWLASAVTLVIGWRPGTYLALILIWAIPPIMLQLFFGADLLWRRRRLVALALLSVTVYLGAADSLAIESGTWTIAPDQSLSLFIGALPVEELVFFLATNTLIVFGMTLMLSAESRVRFQRLVKILRGGTSLVRRTD